MSDDTAVLNRAYWMLREHASAYRATKGYRQARDAQEADRDDEVKRTRYVLHEWFARGIEAAARDIAELMDVPEHEIEPIELTVASSGELVSNPVTGASLGVVVSGETARVNEIIEDRQRKKEDHE